MKDYDSVEEKVIYQKLLKGITDFEKAIPVGETFPTDGFMLESNNVDHDRYHQYFSEISRYIEIMESTRINLADRYLFSTRKVLGKVVVFCKRIIRRLLRWYINPVVQQQSEFNGAVTASIGRLTELEGQLHSVCLDLSFKVEEQKQLKKDMISDLIQQFEEDVISDLMKKLKEDAISDLTQLIKESSEKSESQVHELENLVEYTNIKLNNFQGKIECLEELELDIFKSENKSFWDKKTVSQSGEDAICAYIIFVLGKKAEDCVYLDLGANHAKELSNTYYFYSKGSRGVLVEANPALITELKFYRNGDKILNKCVSAKSGEKVNFYVLSGDGLSSPDLNAVNDLIEKNPELKVVESVMIETITVNDIIDQYLGEAPMLLNIDIEGKDLEILESIDFDHYRPLIVIAEMIEYQMGLVIGQKNESIINFMESKDYIEYAFTGINSIFVDKHQLKEKYS